MSSTDRRTLIARPTWGTLRQGTVFSGAVADGYEACVVHGVVITARCDLAHIKVPLVNYVPVVRLGDWLCRDYAAVLSERLKKGARGRLADLLKAEGHSPSVLETMPASAVVERLFPTGAKGKSATRGAKALESAAAVALCERVGQELPINVAHLGKLEAIDPGSAGRLLDDCVRDQLGDYQFLSHIDRDGDHDGYVALLRQVYHLPQELAKQVAGGLELPASDPPHALLADAGFAGPVGEITSPFVELLMQRFTVLFSRIGVPDIRPEYTARFINEVGRRE